jgi:hypothetical protein
MNTSDLERSLYLGTEYILGYVRLDLTYLDYFFNCFNFYVRK